MDMGSLRAGLALLLIGVLIYAVGEGQTLSEIGAGVAVVGVIVLVVGLVRGPAKTTD